MPRATRAFRVPGTDRFSLWPHGATVEVVEPPGQEGRDGIYVIRSADASPNGKGVGMTGMEVEHLCRWWAEYKARARIPPELLE